MEEADQNLQGTERGVYPTQKGQFDVEERIEFLFAVGRRG